MKPVAHSPMPAAIALLVLLCAVALTPLNGTAELVDRVVAVVNDDVITLSELEKEGEPFYRDISAKTFRKPANTSSTGSSKNDWSPRRPRLPIYRCLMPKWTPPSNRCSPRTKSAGTDFSTGSKARESPKRPTRRTCEPRFFKAKW
jgi:hypothetical protein